MKKIRFDHNPMFTDYDEPEPPRGGWHEPCSYTDHRWGLELDGGQASIMCLDPCEEGLYDPAGITPACLNTWEIDDFTTPEPIAVELTYVDDSTPSTPAGPAEYGFYIEVRASSA